MDTNIHAMVDYSLLKLLICSLAMFFASVHANNQTGFVPITYLESAKASGAVCLDGSPPAYYYDEGYGEGSNNWLVRLEGGGWCTSDEECRDDVKSWKETWNCNYDGCANSYKRSPNMYFSGIMSSSIIVNPDFYNWNRVHIVYCDGGSFSGDVEEVNPAKLVYRRGAKIFDAVINDLKNKGLSNASNAILAGYSAGGLATVLNCDKFRGIVSNVERVKCIVDSGFFIHAKDLAGAVEIREARFNKVVAYHGLDKFLPSTCTSQMSPGLCLFPENLVGNIQTPLFLIDSLFDFFQLYFQMPDLGNNWGTCVTKNPEVCYSNQTLVQPVKDFRAEFLKTLPKCGSIGMFIDTCSVHGHSVSNSIWSRWTVNNTILSKAVGDWYFDRNYFCAIDTTNDFIHLC